MPETNLNEVYKAIGTLTAEVAGLRKDIRENEQRHAESIRRADESRASVHRRLDEITERTGHLEAGMDSLRHDTDDMKKVTDEVRAWKQRGIGALFVVGIASAALSGMIVHYWESFVRFLNSHLN